MTTPNSETKLSDAARALAAWESTLAQNLNPLLGEETAAAVWEAVLAHRTTGDAEAFIATIREATAEASSAARDAVEQAIRSLTALRATSQE